MSKNMAAGGCIVLVVLILSFPIIMTSWWWGGFALSYSWNELMAPMGFITITTVQGMAITMIAGFVTKNIVWADDNKDDDNKDTEKVIKDAIKGIAAGFLRPLFLMFFTWVLVWASS